MAAAPVRGQGAWTVLPDTPPMINGAKSKIVMTVKRNMSCAERL